MKSHSTPQKLWTEIVHANADWYLEYVSRLEADCRATGIDKEVRFERARGTAHTHLLNYSETVQPENYEQVFHLAAVFRGYRHLGSRITDIEGRLAFIIIFAVNSAEGLKNVIEHHWS